MDSIYKTTGIALGDGLEVSS